MKVSVDQFPHITFKHQARTLPPSSVGSHESGWTIQGEIQEDYYRWINDFEATHPVFGWVKGNYESMIHAKSKKAYDHFIANHPPEDWDYWDI